MYSTSPLYQANKVYGEMGNLHVRKGGDSKRSCQIWPSGVVLLCIRTKSGLALLLGMLGTDLGWT